MAQGKDYVIRGGAAGRERLRMLSRVMYASTASLFDRFRFKDWQQCLDIGCGGGDVTLELAPVLVLTWVWSGLFAVNMIMKEASMSRYPEWQAYRARTGWLLPKFVLTKLMNA